MHAREPASLFWREFGGSCRYSIRANVVVAKTRHQMLEVLSFYDRESAKRPSLKITMLTFRVNMVK